MSAIVARLGKWWPIIAVLAITAVAYAPALRTGYFADDFDYAVRYRDGEQFRRALIRNTDGTAGGGSWRPLTAASLWLSMQVQSPMFDHVVSLALYLVLVAVVFLLTQNLFPDRGRFFSIAVALIAALIPAHVEPVVWIGARADVLAAVFGVAAVLAWLRGRHWPALALLTISLLSKETWFFVGFILPLVSARSAADRSVRWTWLLAYACTGAAWLLARFMITGYGAGGYSITAEQRVFGVQHIANEIIAFATGVFSFGEFQSLAIRFSQHYWFVMIWVVGAVALLVARHAWKTGPSRLCLLGLVTTGAPALMLSIPMITPAASIGEQRYWFASSFFLVLLVASLVVQLPRRVFWPAAVLGAVIFVMGTRYNVALFETAAVQRDAIISAWRKLESRAVSGAHVYGLPDSWHGVHLFASPFFERALSYYYLPQPASVEPWYQWCSAQCAASPARVRRQNATVIFESDDARIFSTTSRGLRFSINISQEKAKKVLFWTGTEWVFSQAGAVENHQNTRY